MSCTRVSGIIKLTKTVAARSNVFAALEKIGRRVACGQLGIGISARLAISQRSTRRATRYTSIWMPKIPANSSKKQIRLNAVNQIINLWCLTIFYVLFVFILLSRSNRKQMNISFV